MFGRLFSKIVLLSTLALSAQWVHASEFRSVKGQSANIRVAPNTKSEVAWELTRGYPLAVVKKKGNWLQVKDIDGVLGWVYKPITGTAPHHLVKVKTANLRAGAGTQHKVVAKLDKYDVVKTIDKKNGWAKVRTSAGTQGWVSQKLIWGW